MPKFMAVASQVGHRMRKFVNFVPCAPLHLSSTPPLIISGIFQFSFFAGSLAEIVALGIDMSWKA
jgi:hypothetical protein